MQIHHAHAVCGIVAHVEDPSATTIAPRCLAIVAPALSDIAEQKEVLEILQRLEAKKWPVDNMATELKTAWGWKESRSTGSSKLSAEVFSTGSSRGAAPVKLSSSPQFKGTTGRTLNPLASADFSLPNHPYQNWYEPPNGEVNFR